MLELLLALQQVGAKQVTSNMRKTVDRLFVASFVILLCVSMSFSLDNTEKFVYYCCFLRLLLKVSD